MTDKEAARARKAAYRAANAEKIKARKAADRAAAKARRDALRAEDVEKNNARKAKYDALREREAAARSHR